MAKDSKILSFGIHGMTIRDYFTGVPVVELDVVGDLDIPVTAETEDIFGGSHIWAVGGEPTIISSDGSLELREFPEDIAEYLAAGVGASVAASATGTATTLTNYYGETVVDAATGIATVGLKTGETAELKAGRYMVLAASATTVDVYATTTVDLKKGTAIVPVDDTLKITASPLSITTGSAVEVTNLGVELTGGSGTIEMTAGDTAFFDIYPPHNKVETITLGAADSSFKRVALTLSAQKRTTGEIGYIDCPNALALGIPFSVKEKVWSGGSVNIKIYVNEALDYAMRFTHIRGTSI